jgi:uncharacterized membrane protein YdjX (TVP38/TMEM64 family)
VLKLLLLLLVLAAIAYFFIFDLQQYVTLEYIKQQHNTVLEYYQNNRFFIVLFFAFVYIAVTALSLPAATILTLLGGAVFEFGLGLLIVSFASSIGATIAFSVSRFLARDYVQKNYSKQLAKINEGFAKEGAFYLFALRLTPVFPFFMVNILTALLPIKLKTFYLVSQIGMLPATAVFVYAGTQLAKIESLSDIASPSLLVSLACLGLFPIVAKKTLDILRKEKING